MKNAVYGIKKTIIMAISIIIENSFEKWMKTLGYADSTVYLSTHYVRDFFFYLKTRNLSEIEDISAGVLDDYYSHLQRRCNKRRTGGLSGNYINSNINALKRLSRYLQESGKPFFEVATRTRPDKETLKAILTREEIFLLYKSCSADYLGVRDRAMLGVYYGCGLRRSEGISLDVRDVMLKERLVFVRKGKGNRERYVPMTGAVASDMEEYISQVREQIRSLTGGKTTDALFISMKGKRLCGNQAIQRLQSLAKEAGINKQTGLHTLRHSIATHLLQSGLTLEEVSRFLGHTSLESTQIYTHLSHE
jgi:integrase/recombinase XerD